ncbi:MAG: N-acetyltransferase family protein, partial [Armatimonadota bacterium]|nr:N-acetyltransferase family protein [Armatimonadota bacterium]
MYHTTMNHDALEVQIRPATETDLDAINTIYNYYVHHSTCTYALEPTGYDERRAWFVERGPAFPVLVAERDGEVIGWGSLSPFHPRPAYRFTVENSIYVRHDSLALGIGTGLLAHLMEDAHAL